MAGRDQCSKRLDNLNVKKSLDWVAYNRGVLKELGHVIARSLFPSADHAIKVLVQSLPVI